MNKGKKTELKLEKVSGGVFREMIGRCRRDGGLLLIRSYTCCCIFISLFSDPTSIILFSFYFELEEVADGMVARAIHCAGVGSGFISSLVGKGRQRTGCLRR